MANVFLKSALTKVQGSNTTITLFTYEYQVSLPSPAAAAYLATGVDLLFSALLAVGLAGRLGAFVLFVFNIVAVVS